MAPDMREFIENAGKGYVDEKSTLATMLENPDNINISNNDIGELI